jgi:hypothetical protein
MTEEELIQQAKNEMEALVLKGGGSLTMKGVLINSDYFITKLVRDYRADCPGQPIKGILDAALKWARDGFKR